MEKIIDLKKKIKEEDEEFLEETEEQSGESFDGLPEATPLSWVYQPVEMRWSGRSHNYPNKKFFYPFLAVLGGSGAFFLFSQHSLLTAVFFFAATIFLFAHSFKHPQEVDYFVGPHGIRVGLAEYRISDVKSFWVEYNPGGLQELSLQLKKWHSPYVKLSLEGQDPVHVRNLLLEYIPEVERSYNVIDAIEYHLGF